MKPPLFFRALTLVIVATLGTLGQLTPCVHAADAVAPAVISASQFPVDLKGQDPNGRLYFGIQVAAKGSASDGYRVGYLPQIVAITP